MKKLNQATENEIYKLLENKKFKEKISNLNIEREVCIFKEEVFNNMVADMKYFNVEKQQCIIEVSKEKYLEFANSISETCRGYDEILEASCELQLALTLDKKEYEEEEIEKIKNNLIYEIERMVIQIGDWSFDNYLLAQFILDERAEELNNYFYDEEYKVYELKPIE